MRKLKLLMLAFMATCGLGVNAAVSYEVDQKFTSIEDLEGQKFTIVNETDGKAVYNSDNQNLKYDTYATAVTGASYQWILESAGDDNNVAGCYTLRAVKTNGSNVEFWGNSDPKYLNSGDPDGTHGNANPFNGCFVLGNNNQYGTDMLYGGVWEIEYLEGSGFALKNKALGGYFNGPGSAATGTDPIYWTFCTLKEGEEIPDPVIPEPEAPLADGELIPDFFSICSGGGIPYGYNVKFGSEDRAYPTTYGSGARMFEFAEGGDFKRGLYFREGYVQYGTVKELALEAGTTYTVHFNSAMWKSSGSQMTFQIFKADNLETAVLTKTINNTPDVNGSTAAVSGSTSSQIEFTPETAGNYILKWTADGWKEIILANVGVRVGAAPLNTSAYTALKEKYLAIYPELDIEEAETLLASATTADELQAAIAKLVSAFASSLTDGTSLTGLITNPSFESGFTGWTNNGMATQNNNSFPGKVGTNYCEAWQPNGTKGVSQTLTLPKGAYRLTANSLARGVTSAKLYIGTKETAITIADASNNYRADILSANDGEVTIGFEGVGSGAGASWLCVDNFQLTYLGDMTADEFEAFEAYQAALDAYNEAMAAAQGLSGKVPTAAYGPVQQAINQNTVTDGTTDQYNTAAVALNAAVANAQPLAAPYATWLTLKANALTVATGHTKITAAINKVVLYVETLTAKDDLDNVNIMAAALIKNYRAWDELKKNADALEATSTTDVAGRTEVAEVRDAQAANISNAAVDTQEDIATLINVTIPTATATLKAKMTTYVKTAQPTNDECFDITFLIENAHFYEGEGGNKAATGWTLESGAITEHRLLTHNFEAYHTPFNLSQTITDLPKGTYKVTLQGFARHDNNGPTDKTNLYCGIVDQKIKDINDEYSTKSLISGKPNMGDGNGESNTDGKYRPNGMSGSYYFFQEVNTLITPNQPFYTNEVQTIINQPGDLKIGFKCETNNDWVIWDNFHLYYYGSAIAVEINEESPKSYSEDVENANVTLKRTFKNNGAWNTFFVPFDLSDEDTKAAFGSDVEVATYTETVEGIHSTISFNKANNAAITANTPVLLKTNTGETTFTFNGKTIKAGKAKAAGTNFDFVGTYAASTTIAEGDYFIGTSTVDNESKLFQSTGDTTIKGLRAYLKKTESADPEARIIKFIIGGEETTAIKGLKVAGNSGKIYNLNGQEVKNASKGIFIQNGKKIVVK